MHQNPFPGETVGIKGGQHGNPRLGHAVLPTAGTGHNGAATGHIDDDAPASVQRLLCNHLFCHRLCQEHISLGVDAHYPVKALLGHFQQISAHPGCHAGVVDQHIHPSKGFHRFRNNAEPVIMVCNIGLHIVHRNALAVEGIHRRLIVPLRPRRHHHNVVSVPAQLAGNGQADSAAGTGHNC